jgi:polar amino acid transport system substrate-binding protein
MMKARNLLFGACTLFIAGASAMAQSMPMRIDFQDTSPKYIKNANGRFSGLCLDLMSLIEQNSNIKFTYGSDFVPPKRIIARLMDGETDVHCGFAKTPEREGTLNYAEAIYDVNYVLVARAEEPAAVSSMEDVKKLGKDGVVLGVFGTSSNDKLRKMGLTVDDGGKDVEVNFSKLLLGRGRFFVYHDLGTLYEMNQPKYKGKFKTVPVDIESYQHWMVFSKKASPGLVAETLRVIQKLKASGEWGKVTSKYVKS